MRVLGLYPSQLKVLSIILGCCFVQADLSLKGAAADGSHLMLHHGDRRLARGADVLGSMTFDKLFARADGQSGGSCKKCGGCKGKEIQDGDEICPQCKPCPAKKKPNRDRTRCIADDEDENRRGKCPPGKILDPAVPGQNENTNNPKCIDKPGDDEEEKKKEEEEKKKEEEEKKAKELADNKAKIRQRRGACLALGTMTWMTSLVVDDDPSIAEPLSDDEIAGLLEPESDSIPVPQQELLDGMVVLRPILHATVEMDTAGIPWAAIFSAAGKTSAQISNKAAKLLGKAIENTGDARFVNLKKPDKTVPASAKALDAANKSAKVKKIRENLTYKACIALGAVAPMARKGRRADAPTKTDFIDGGFDYQVQIDLNSNSAKGGGTPTDQLDKVIVMSAANGEDIAGGDQAEVQIQSYRDNYVRQDRLYYQQCGNFINNMYHATSSVQVWGGCCQFYRNADCDPGSRMFAMTDREDGNLKGDSNNAIASYWCTFDKLCAGRP